MNYLIKIIIYLRFIIIIIIINSFTAFCFSITLHIHLNPQHSSIKPLCLELLPSKPILLTINNNFIQKLRD